MSVVGESNERAAPKKAREARDGRVRNGVFEPAATGKELLILKAISFALPEIRRPEECVGPPMPQLFSLH